VSREPVQLTSDQRVTLTALADVIVPSTGGMPSASEADPTGRWLDRVLRARPDLVTPLRHLLDRAADCDPEEEVRRLSGEDPDGFGVLVLVVTGSYYLNVKVRRRIGYPGQNAVPPYPDEADYYLDGGLLDPVRSRAPFYRVVDRR
jgi:hypothetical protein